MANSAEGGHVEIVKLCKEWDVADFDWVMLNSAEGGHVEIVKIMGCN